MTRPADPNAAPRDALQRDVPPRAPAAQADFLVPVGTVAVFVLLLAVSHSILVRLGVLYGEQSRYSHCLLLPLISALAVWDRWDRLRRIPRRASWAGVAAVALATGLLLFGLAQGGTRIPHFAFLLALPATVWALFGGRMVLALAFPLGYLALTVPLPKTWDDAITLPLQDVATRASAAVFELLGWSVARQGNVLQLPGLRLLVEDACSGIHSLYALVALGVAWVAFTDRPLWVRFALVAATVPVAVLANTLRVIATGILAYKVDPEYARGLSHEATGMVVFGTGVVLFLVCDWCLRPDDGDGDAGRADAPPAGAAQ
jgi:exosortase